MGNDCVFLEIRAESIYLHSIATLIYSSPKSFKINFQEGIEVIRLLKGKRRIDGSVLSQKKGRSYVVEALVMGLFKEREALSVVYERGLCICYGMSFYPFVSSFIRGTIFCSNRVDNISLVLPDMFRLVFCESSIRQNGRSSALRHSYGKESSSFIFSWKDEICDLAGYNLDFDISVRYGGVTLLRMTQFPIYYWIIALLGVSVLSFNENVSIVVGAIATVWLFLLQRWNNSFVPRKDTLLTRFYLVYGAVLGGWGILWKVCGVQAVFLIPPVVFMLYFTLAAISFFEKTGTLPKYVAEPYAKMVLRKELKLIMPQKIEDLSLNHSRSASYICFRRPVMS